jgi:hypothetical protein
MEEERQMSGGKARERAIKQVADAMLHSGVVHGDPDDIYTYAELAVDALLVHGLDPKDGYYRAGWLTRYGHVHEVIAADMQDYSYVVWTRDLDPDVPGDDEEDEDG